MQSVRQLERDLQLEQANLQGLIRDTRDLVGTAAARAFVTIHKLSNSTFKDGSMIVKSLQLPEKDNVLSLPTMDFPLGEEALERYDHTHAISTDDYRVLRVAAYDIKKPSRSFTPPLLQGARGKVVTVSFDDPRRADFRISPRGDAVMISKREVAADRPMVDFEQKLRPLALSGELADSYKSEADLVNDYAESYTGALAVTQIINTVVSRACHADIMDDNYELLELVESWQDVSRPWRKGAVIEEDSFLERFLAKTDYTHRSPSSIAM